MRTKKHWTFIRGMLSESYHWQEFVQSFSTHFPNDDVEYPEIPGNGNLSHQLTPPFPRFAVNSIRKQIKQSQIKTNIIGFSLGGMLGLKWAELYPDEVESLVLINCSLKHSPMHKRMRPTALLKMAQIAIQKDPLKRQTLSLKMTANLPHSSLQKYTQIWHDREKEFPIKPTNFFLQVALGSNMKIQHKEFEKKILILSGAKDQVVNPDCSKKLAQEFKAPHFEHPEAGHDLTLFDPNWVAQKIFDWEASSR